MTDAELDRIADRFFMVSNQLTPLQWRSFARAVITTYELENLPPEPTTAQGTQTSPDAMHAAVTDCSGGGCANEWLIKQLRKELAELRQRELQDAQTARDLRRAYEIADINAKRYRWLRMQRIVFDADRITPLRPEKLDTLVDEAIKIEGGHV